MTAVAVGLNGVGGFAFWAIVARLDDATAVGSAQELFTAVLVATYLTSLGLPVAVAKFSSDRSPTSATFFRVSVVATAVSSVVGATGIVVLGAGRSLLAPLAGLGALAQIVVLSTIVIGMSCAVLVEVRLIGLRRWDLVLLRVLGVVALRFPLLAVAPDDAAHYWFLLVAGVPATTGCVGAVALWRRHGESVAVTAPVRRAWIRFSSVNFLGLLGAQGPQFLVPLVVALQVPSADYAPFYLAWGATAIVFVIPHMAGQALLAESSKQGTEPRSLVRTTLTLSLTATSAITLASFAAGPVVHLVLGDEYTSTAAVLPWLLGAAVPWSITATALADARVRSADRSVLALTVSFLVTVLGAVAIGTAVDGILGASAGWLFANVAVGAVAATRLRPSLSMRDRRRPVLDVVAERGVVVGS